MTTDLATKYQPAEVESEVARRWADAGAFHKEPTDTGDPYCIVIPPPNVTAALHMGHALNNTLQDILIRWRRMAGDNAVWIPGTDHAGIATQTVVEKRILAEEGKKRTDFKRDDFVARVQAWKDEYEQKITHQLKEMGCSCDWDRQRFTMDPICARSVREAFFRLFKDGLIYRGKRLVNWDPATQTALADDEVEMRDIDGHFWYMKYPLVDEGGNDTGEYVTVATTRPETMLGDTAVAVNPKDADRAALIGQKVRLPIVNRIIPVIGDDYVVIPDPESEDAKASYASGFLKVTPAHDPNDYEIGQRHDLEVINVMAPDGSISDQHGWPAEDIEHADKDNVPLGLDRYEARETIVDWFRKNHLLEEVRSYRHSVGHSYRSHVPIEPYLSDQWYVRVTDDRLAGAALRAISADQYQHHSEHEIKRETKGADWEGRLNFHPARYSKTFQTWHENIRDWCISRQLWWGHRIPVWRSPTGMNRPLDSRLGDQIEALAQWIDDGRIALTFAGGTMRSNPEKLAIVLDLAGDGAEDNDESVTICVRDPDGEDRDIIEVLELEGFVRDPDVLDTWFSSALWPFSTLGWPEETAELAKWNPGSVLCTAREIITLWVSRMVMMNLYLLGRLPFDDVFIHAMIQDGEGRKMSKSLGNGVDPLDIIHSHGSDAMRYTLAAMTTSTQDVRLPVAKDPETGRNTSEKFDVGRNFANKLWNAARFALQNLEGGEVAAGGDDELGLADRWILSRLAGVVQESSRALEQYEFSKYAQGLYDFFWRDLCDWYIEAVKPTIQSNAAQRGVLASCLDVALRLLHPVMPFVTERLWQRLNEVAPGRVGAVGELKIPASELLIRAPWPVADGVLIDSELEGQFGLLQAVIGAIREVRTTHKVPPKQQLNVVFEAPAGEMRQLDAQRGYVESMANVLVQAEVPEADGGGQPGVGTAGKVRVSVFRDDGGLVESGAERDRLSKQLGEAQRSVETLKGRLSNKGYVDRAPAHLVQQTRDQLSEAEKEAASLEQQLATIK